MGKYYIHVFSIIIRLLGRKDFKDFFMNPLIVQVIRIELQKDELNVNIEVFTW